MAIAAWLSMPISTGSGGASPSSLRKEERNTPSLAASDAAMISASHDDSATEFCFLDPQLITAEE